MSQLGSHSRLLLPVGIENQFFLVTSGSFPEGLPFSKLPEEEIQFEFHLDTEAFGFLAEELVSQGATRIAVDPMSAFSLHKRGLTYVMRRRVDVLDSRRRIWAQSMTILLPIASELGVDLNDSKNLLHSWIRPHLQKALQDPGRARLYESLTAVHQTVYHLLLGIRQQLQIDVDLFRTWNALQRLRTFCSSKEAGANLAFLEAILRAYQTEDVGGFTMHPGVDRAALLESFEEFMEDEVYRQLSVQRHALGVPAVVNRAVTETRRLARRLVTRKSFGRLFNFATKAVSVATALPMPNSEVAASLLKERFLPPIVNIRDPISEARRTWEAANTVYRPMSIGPFEPPKAYAPTRSIYRRGSLSATYDVFEFLNMYTLASLPKVHDQRLQETFQAYFAANLSPPFSCSRHKSTVGMESVQVEWTDTELRFRIRGCCKRASDSALTKMLAYDESKTYS